MLLYVKEMQFAEYFAKIVVDGLCSIVSDTCTSLGHIYMTAHKLIPMYALYHMDF